MTPSPTPQARGSLHILCAFDLGFEVKLSMLAQLFASRYRDPVHYSFMAGGSGRDTRPVRIQFDPVDVDLGPVLKRRFDVFATFFELGALSLEFVCKFDENLSELPRIVEKLHTSKDFVAIARRLADAIAHTAKPAIVNPDTDLKYSTFTVVSVSDLEPDLKAAEIVAQLGRSVAKTLRYSSDDIGQSEVNRTLTPHVTYSDDDAVFVSRHVAVVFDETSSEVVDVFELANLQALELEVIDARLDQAIQEMYAEPERGKSFFGRMFNRNDRHARKLHLLSLDATILVDRTEHMFKFATDSYLVQIHELCVQKLFLKPLSLAVDRKLRAIRDIVNDQRDLASSIRMEFLEWIIIVLIAIGTVPTIIGMFPK